MSAVAAPEACTVVIPARMASSRLPDKPLADIAGLPMVVRVAQRAALSGAARVVVAADDARVLQACQAHGVPAILTRTDHASGSDRLAEACEQLGLAGDDIVVNVQGDEPLMDPGLIDAVAALLPARPEASMGTAAHAIATLADYENPNVVKVYSMHAAWRTTSAARPFRGHATMRALRGGTTPRAPCPPALPRCATSASTATARVFCAPFPP